MNKSRIIQDEKPQSLNTTNSAPPTEAHAVSLLTKALALDRSLAVAHFELGNLALSKGQVAQAVTQLEAATKLSPDDSRAHYALSRAYRRLGRIEDADRELRTFQSLKGKGTE